jgi:ribosomal protein L29
MANDLMGKSVEDIRAAIVEKREALRAFRFGASGSRARNTQEGRLLRKDIARLMTELSVRRLSSGKGEIAENKKAQ